MKNNKKKTKKIIPRTMILFFIMVATFLTSMTSQARYRITGNASLGINLAKWTFNIKDNTQQNFIVDLAQYKNANEGETVNRTIISPRR